MSHVVNTSTDTSTRGQDPPGSVRVAPCSETAVRTLEGSFGEPEACLSLAAPRTRHPRVGGRHQHHRSARPRAIFNKLSLGCADRGVSSLAGHRRLREKRGFEVLNRDQLRAVNNGLRPKSGLVGVLALSFLVHFRDVESRHSIAGRLGLASRSHAATHPPLGSAQRGCAAFAMSEVRQVINRVSCSVRPVAQPCRSATGLGEELGQATACRLVPRSLLMDCFVPVEPAAMPLGNQRCLRLHARPQAIRVTHGFFPKRNVLLRPDTRFNPIHRYHPGAL